MKRTNTKLKLKRQLELVRTTVRELTAAELGVINGGNDELVTRYDTNCGTCCCNTSGVPDPAV